MKLRILPFSSCWILVLFSFSSIWLNPVDSSPSIKLFPGVVIETVAKNSVAERAGIQPGDVLLNWVREDAKGQLESPFDLSLLEVEEAPLGNVTVEGLRNAERREWILGPDGWGLHTRPNLQGAILDSYQEGKALSVAGRFTDAAEHWLRLAVEAGTSNAGQNHSLAFWLRFHVAEMLGNERLYKDADNAYEQAVETSAMADPRITAQVYRGWADSFQRRGDWDKAEKRYMHAETEDEKSGHVNLAVALDLYDLGLVAGKRGDSLKAEQLYRQALDIQQKLAPESLVTASSLNSLGTLALNRSDLATAEDLYLQALGIRQKLAPETLSVAASIYNLGLVAWTRGDIGKADEYYTQALELHTKLAPGSLALALNLNNLGLVTWRQGDLIKAKEYHTQALEIRQKLAPGSIDLAASINNLGAIALDQGDIIKAEEFFSRALEIKERVAPGSLSSATTLDDLGELERMRGNLAKAEEYYQRSLEIHARLAPASLGFAEVVNNLGDLAKTEGNFATAEQRYNEALEVAEKLSPDGLTTAFIRQGIGDLARERGDLKTAEQYYRQALSTFEKLIPGSKSHAEALASLASVMRNLGQPESAARLYEQALNAVETQTARLGGSEDARWDFRAKHVSYYKDYIDLLILQKKPLQAFSVLERSRARSLLETLATAHINISNGVDPRLQSLKCSLQADIAAKSSRRLALLNSKHQEHQAALVETEIANLLTRYREVEEKIRSTNPIYASLTQPQTLSVQEVQKQLLDSNTLLLEFNLGEERSYLFVVDKNVLKVFTLPKRSEIENLASSVYGLLTARNQIIAGETDRQAEKRWAEMDAQYPREAAKLSQMILGPVATLIKRKRLVIVSDGSLQYLPFAALPIPKETNVGVASEAGQQALARSTEDAGMPLAATHEILSLPSASALAELRREQVNRPDPKKDVVVLADPVFDAKDPRVLNGDTLQNRHVSGSSSPAKTLLQESSLSRDHLTRSASVIGLTNNGQINLRRLEYTRQEADAILAVTPQGKGLAVLDFQASREMAMSSRLAEYRVVHFATHGLVNNDHPELSGLVLSLVNRHGKPQDGFLDLQDIYNLHLPVNLVVLSGCETGLGKEINGEGLIGLTRGFMYAGASRVMASLWSVSDQATAEFMAAFYKALEQEKMLPAAALREAQMEMRKQDMWKSPYYWAAFQLQGEWK